MTTENIIGLLLISFQVQIILIAWQIGYKRKYHRGYTGRTGDQGEKGDQGPKGIDHKKEDTGIREGNFIGYEKNKPTGLRVNKEEDWVVSRIGTSEGNNVEYLMGEYHWTYHRHRAKLLDEDKANSITLGLIGTEGYAYSVETLDHKIEEDENRRSK